MKISCFHIDFLSGSNSSKVKVTLRRLGLQNSSHITLDIVAHSIEVLVEMPRSAQKVI